MNPQIAEDKINEPIILILDDGGSRVRSGGTAVVGDEGGFGEEMRGAQVGGAVAEVDAEGGDGVEGLGGGGEDCVGGLVG